MSYEKLPTLARKAPFTAARYNQLRQNGRTLQNTLRAEHLEASGAHNAVTFARTLGTVKVVAGPTYSLVGFNGNASSVSNPAAGKSTVVLAADKFTANRAPIMLQSASENGDLKPCIATAVWDDDTHVTVRHKKWNGTLGTPASGFWSVEEDASYFMGVHGQQLAQGAPGGMGRAAARTNGLQAAEPDSGFNEFIQTAANLQVALDAEHTAGVHDTREIPKAWAHFEWNSAAGQWDVIGEAYSSEFDGGFIVDPSTEFSTGVASVQFDSALASADYQVFIDVDYARQDGGSPDDYFIHVVPRDELTTGGFKVYLYQRLLSGPGVEYFDRSSDVDFYVWIFDDH